MRATCRERDGASAMKQPRVVQAFPTASTCRKSHQITCRPFVAEVRDAICTVYIGTVKSASLPSLAQEDP
eukprot:8786533-Pyramimonas_sp.AAC.1